MSFINENGYKVTVDPIYNIKEEPYGHSFRRNKNAGKSKVLEKKLHFFIDVLKSVKPEDFDKDSYLQSGTIMSLLEEVDAEFKLQMDRHRASPSQKDLRNSKPYHISFHNPALYLHHKGIIMYWKRGLIEIHEDISNVRLISKRAIITGWI